MSTYLPADVQQRLLEADDHRCASCQTTQFTSGYPMVIDHIVPRSQGGEIVFENLCYACYRCNEFKGPTTRMADPLTGKIVALFHPCQHRWAEHFAWDAAGIRLVGLTAAGRVIVIALNRNNAVIVEVRQR
jgi:hypothetical protein